MEERMEKKVKGVFSVVYLLEKVERVALSFSFYVIRRS